MILRWRARAFRTCSTGIARPTGPRARTSAAYEVRFAKPPAAATRLAIAAAFETAIAKTAVESSGADTPWLWSGAWALLYVGERGNSERFFPAMAKALAAIHEVAPIAEVIMGNARETGDDAWDAWSHAQQTEPSPHPRFSGYERIYGGDRTIPKSAAAKPDAAFERARGAAKPKAKPVAKPKPAPQAKAKPKAPPPAPAGSLEDVIAELRATPDDIALARMYGLHLAAAGDPRGELVALHTAEKNRTRAQNFRLAVLQGELGLPAEPGVMYASQRWQFGSIYDLHMSLWNWEEGPPTRFATFLRGLTADPALRFLAELELDVTAETGKSAQLIVDALATLPQLRALTLRIRGDMGTGKGLGVLDLAPLAHLGLRTLHVTCKTATNVPAVPSASVNGETVR